MAYTQSRKVKGVGYFNHFPKNFLKPYGRVEAYPPEQVALSRLRPEDCEWLRRPHVATSELCSTVTENLEVPQKPSLLLDDSKIMDFTKNLQPVAQLLAPFHKESQTMPNDVQRRNLLLALLNPGNALAAQLDQCVEPGAALFSIGVNFKVAQTLISNPNNYADMITFAPNKEPTFKTTKNIIDLLPLLHSSKPTSIISTPNI